MSTRDLTRVSHRQDLLKPNKTFGGGTQSHTIQSSQHHSDSDSDSDSPVTATVNFLMRKSVKKNQVKKVSTFFFCFWEQVGSTPRTLATHTTHHTPHTTESTQNQHKTQHTHTHTHTHTHPSSGT